jgi:preprotein translocase subunit SecE
MSQPENSLTGVEDVSTEKTMDEKQSRRRRKSKPEVEEVEEVVEDEVEEDDEERGLTERKGRPTRGRRALVEEVETGNFITRPLRRTATFIQDVRSELGKVTWPTRQETFDLTRIVLVTTILSAITLGIIAAIFTELIRLGLDIPAILIVVVVLAVAVAVYYIRASNRTSRY